MHYMLNIHFGELFRIAQRNFWWTVLTSAEIDNGNTHIQPKMGWVLIITSALTLFTLIAKWKTLKCMGNPQSLRRFFSRNGSATVYDISSLSFSICFFYIISIIIVTKNIIPFRIIDIINSISISGISIIDISIINIIIMNIIISLNIIILIFWLIISIVLW